LEKKVVKINSLAEGMKQVDTVIFATPHEEYKNFEGGFPPSLKIIDLWNIFRNRISNH
jgi:UDP-N-acetyl-D-mannosaminuronate dehydrogenase